MKTTSMGNIHVAAKIENLHDVFDADSGFLSPQRVRFVEVFDAILDAGPTMLSMPRRLIHQLGLQPLGTRRAHMAKGVIEAQADGVVRLTISGRDCSADVLELPNDHSVRIGRLALLALDLVVDPHDQRLVGNPTHGGEHMIEIY